MEVMDSRGVVVSNESVEQEEGDVIKRVVSETRPEGYSYP